MSEALYHFEFDTINPKPLLESLHDYGYNFSVRIPSGEHPRSAVTRIITLHLPESRVEEAYYWVSMFYDESMTKDQFDDLLIRRLRKEV